MTPIPPYAKNLRSFLWHFFFSQKGTFFAILLFSCSWALDATLWPYLLGWATDILSSHDLNRFSAWFFLKTPILWAVALWIFVESQFRLAGFLRAKAFPRFEAQIRMSFFHHIQHHSPPYFQSHFTGSFISQINDITTQSTWILEKFLTIFLPAFVTCLLMLVFLTQIHFLFGLIATLWILSHVSICLFFTYKCSKASEIHGEVKSSLLGKIADSLSNYSAVNLFFRFRFEEKLISSHQKKEEIQHRSARKTVEKMFVFISLIFLGGGITLNGIMISHWIQGKISTGHVIQIFNTSWNLVFL